MDLVLRCFPAGCDQNHHLAVEIDVRNRWRRSLLRSRPRPLCGKGLRITYDHPRRVSDAAAIVAGFARNNLLPRTTPTEQWYKTSLTFTWK